MELGDLEVIATLGVGGFGRVELVKVIMILIVTNLTTIDQCRDRRPSLVFALKVMSKQHLVETLLYCTVLYCTVLYCTVL